jgi:hypothetical protein
MFVDCDAVTQTLILVRMNFMLVSVSSFFLVLFVAQSFVCLFLFILFVYTFALHMLLPLFLILFCTLHLSRFNR